MSFLETAPERDSFSLICMSCFVFGNTDQCFATQLVGVSDGLQYLPQRPRARRPRRSETVMMVHQENTHGSFLYFMRKIFFFFVHLPLQQPPPRCVELCCVDRWGWRPGHCPHQS